MEKSPSILSLILPVIAMLFFCEVNGQQLSSSDSLYFLNVRTELGPFRKSDFQNGQYYAIICHRTHHDRKRKSAKFQIFCITNRKGFDTNSTLEKKKLLKNTRELSIRSLFTSEQIIIYDTKIKPGKPL